MTKNRPGPLTPSNLPKRNITALSYSLTSFSEIKAKMAKNIAKNTINPPPPPSSLFCANTGLINPLIDNIT